MSSHLHLACPGQSLKSPPAFHVFFILLHAADFRTHHQRICLSVCLSVCLGCFDTVVKAVTPAQYTILLTRKTNVPEKLPSCQANV
jgi:hypothetical protein